MRDDLGEQMAALKQLQADLLKVRATKEKVLADLNIQRGELQEAIRKLCLDLAACNLLMDHLTAEDNPHKEEEPKEKQKKK